VTPTPLVTVVLATYNQQDFVKNALESILAQTYKNLEIIVCDNGSTDKTKEIIRSIVSKFQKIVFLDFKNNKNITIRHNHYINLANGEFVSILFGDDYYWREEDDTLSLHKAYQEFIIKKNIKKWCVFKSQITIIKDE